MSATTSSNTPIPVRWLDLRGSGLSILERLLLEECLLREDSHNWIIAGTHEATPHRYLRQTPSLVSSKSSMTTKTTPLTGELPIQNTTSAIVLGLGGKPHKLLDMDRVNREGCMCIKRFTGGGTVVLDADSIWTTLIFRPSSPPPSSSTVDGEIESDTSSSSSNANELPQLFPRPIMEWSSNRLFAPVFASLNEQQQSKSMKDNTNSNNNTSSRSNQRTLILDTKSCAAENTGRVIQVPRPKSNNIVANLETTSTTTTTTGQSLPEFALRENDYVLGNDYKMGGNAQAITKQGWLHHTSFLWDYQVDNMKYLTLPAKRPEYRQNRDHNDFLIKLQTVYPHLTKKDFIHTLANIVDQEFRMERLLLPQVLQEMEQQQQQLLKRGGGEGLQKWFDTKSRTRVLTDL